MTFGPTFPEELQAAGCLQVVATWGSDGTIAYVPAATQDQLDTIQKVIAAHDPTKTPAPPVSGDAIISALTNAQAAQVAKDALRISWRDDVPVTNPKLVRIAKAIGKSPEDLWSLAAS